MGRVPSRARARHRLRVVLRARGTPLVLLAIAAYAAWLAHASIGWDWELVGVGAVAMVLGLGLLRADPAPVVRGALPEVVFAGACVRAEIDCRLRSARQPRDRPGHRSALTRRPEGRPRAPRRRRALGPVVVPARRAPRQRLPRPGQARPRRAPTARRSRRTRAAGSSGARTPASSPGENVTRPSRVCNSSDPS